MRESWVEVRSKAPRSLLDGYRVAERLVGGFGVGTEADVLISARPHVRAEFVAGDWRFLPWHSKRVAW